MHSVEIFNDYLSSILLPAKLFHSEKFLYTANIIDKGGCQSLTVYDLVGREPASLSYLSRFTLLVADWSYIVELSQSYYATVMSSDKDS